MSHMATNWAIRQRGLKPAAKLVLWHLCDRYNPDYGCFPDQVTLAHDCEMSRSSLNNQLEVLEATGLIVRERRLDKRTRKQESTRYRFPFEDDFPCPNIGHGCDRETVEPSPKSGHGPEPEPESKKGELYLKVTFGGSFTILFWSARHSWIEKRLTYVFFRHFWHVEFPFHFGLCRLVVRISKLFGCGLGFCVCHFAAFVR